jgi:pimeloyl-ACP methyl ester carboxylesterase
VVAEPNLDPGGGPFSRSIATMDEVDYLHAGHARRVAEVSAGGNAIWAATLRASAPRAVWRGADALVRGGTPGWREQLLALRCPVHAIWGARSLPSPPFEALVSAGVSHSIVPDAGHSIPWDNPRGLALAIARGLH